MQPKNQLNAGSFKPGMASGALVSLLFFTISSYAGQAQCQTAAAPGTTPPDVVSAKTAQHHGLFAVRVTGQGPAVILIPGLSSSGDTWNGTVDHLKSRYQCHVLTLAGFAGEPAWADVNKGKFLMAVEDELAAYVAQNKLSKPVVVGHSLGGTLALEFAERYSEVPGRLVIVDSLPFLGGVWLQAASAAQADPIANNMKLQIKNQSHDQYLQFVKSGASTRSMVTSDADFAKVTEWGLASDQSTVAEALYELLTTDARAGLPKINSEVLVLATWAGLPGVTSKQIETVDTGQYDGLKHLHLVMAGQEHHFIMLDNPVWFYSQLDSFLVAPSPSASSNAISRGAGSNGAAGEAVGAAH